MIPFLDDGDVRLLHGDAIERLRELPAASVQTVVTSPPYFGLRDYGTGGWEGGDPACDHVNTAASEAKNRLSGGHGSDIRDRTETRPPHSERATVQYRDVCGRCGAQRVDQQLGLEASPQEYVERLAAVFGEVRRVLRDDGTVWLNLGDGYAANRSYQVSDSKHLSHDFGEANAVRVPPGLKPKDLCMIPARVALALQQPYYTGTIRKELDRAWLAAMIDAEGSIGVNRLREVYGRPRECFGVSLKVHNTSRAIVERCAEIAGVGSVLIAESRRRTVYAWSVYGDKARRVLRETYPHLVGKQHEARLGCVAPATEATYGGLRLLHRGSETTVDVPEPSSYWEPGWYLRSEITWCKPAPMPESVRDRPTSATEKVFLLSKQPTYFYDQDAVREPHVTADDPRARKDYQVKRGRPVPMPDGDVQRIGTVGPSTWPEGGRNLRNWWPINPEPFPEAHFATFPQALVEPCVLAGTSEHGACSECGAPWRRVVEQNVNGARHVGPKDEHPDRGDSPSHCSTSRLHNQYFHYERRDRGWEPSCTCDAPVRPCVVLDPFVGSGTTALVARRLGRHAVGIDLSAEYLAIAAQRLQQLSLLA